MEAVVLTTLSDPLAKPCGQKAAKSATTATPTVINRDMAFSPSSTHYHILQLAFESCWPRYDKPKGAVDEQD
jgi:hypothetical protein